jgi:dTDP-4-amino-4,6-dideoxygalactose transaminase
MSKFTLPLMSDNISKEDISSVIDFLSQDKIPKLTNGPKVVEFEQKWSDNH